MFDLLMINSRRLWDYFKNACTILFAFSSAILLFVDKDDLQIDTVLKGIGIIVILLLAAGLYAFVRTIAYKKVDIIEGQAYARYGDLFKIAFRSKNKKKIVVISMNTTYDTIVDSNVSNTSNPLVSPTSIHGQWITAMKKRGVSIAEIDAAISDSLTLQKIPIINTIDGAVKTRGKRDEYPKGSIAIYEYGNTIFYLLALSEFDTNNHAQNNKTDLVNTVIMLLDYYHDNGNGYDIYFPLLGTGLSRTGISKSDSLAILSTMIKLYPEKIHGEANIIVYTKDRKTVSLDL